jgi:hypothetical protein
VNLNIPVVALSIVGILIAVAGIFIEHSIFLIAAGVGTILFAWILQVMASRKT